MEWKEFGFNFCIGKYTLFRVLGKSGDLPPVWQLILNTGTKLKILDTSFKRTMEEAKSWAECKIAEHEWYQIPGYVGQLNFEHSIYGNVLSYNFSFSAWQLGDSEHKFIIAYNTIIGYTDVFGAKLWASQLIWNEVENTNKFTESNQYKLKLSNYNRSKKIKEYLKGSAMPEFVKLNKDDLFLAHKEADENGRKLLEKLYPAEFKKEPEIKPKTGMVVQHRYSPTRFGILFGDNCAISKFVVVYLDHPGWDFWETVKKDWILSNTQSYIPVYVKEGMVTKY